MIKSNGYTLCTEPEEFSIVNLGFRDSIEPACHFILLKIKSSGYSFYGVDCRHSQHPNYSAIDCFICGDDLLLVHDSKYDIYYWAHPNGDTSEEVKNAIASMTPLEVDYNKPWMRIDFSTCMNNLIPDRIWVNAVNHDMTGWELCNRYKNRIESKKKGMKNMSIDRFTEVLKKTGVLGRFDSEGAVYPFYKKLENFDFHKGQILINKKSIDEESDNLVQELPFMLQVPFIDKESSDIIRIMNIDMILIFDYYQVAMNGEINDTFEKICSIIRSDAVASNYWYIIDDVCDFMSTYIFNNKWSVGTISCT